MKILELILAISGASAFCLSWMLSLWFWKTMPTQPDAGGGFVIPMINHGRTIYISEIYSIAYYVLFWGGIGVLFAAVLIDFYKDPFGWRAMKK